MYCTGNRFRNPLSRPYYLGFIFSIGSTDTSSFEYSYCAIDHKIMINKYVLYLYLISFRLKSFCSPQVLLAKPMSCMPSAWVVYIPTSPLQKLRMYLSLQKINKCLPQMTLSQARHARTVIVRWKMRLISVLT